MLKRHTLLLLLALTASAQTPAATHPAPAPAPATINGYQPKWWKEAVVYQVYPRSFNDSNGDGIGDLNGITDKLDYLQRLGIDVIWLSPHFDSPNADNGYDIRDYRRVMAEFGTMDDFDRMLAAIKARHMRLIIDLVVNHTSDEHHWFAESRSSRTNPYRDYYIWRDGRPNLADPTHPLPPNNYPSFFSGSAWQYDEPTQQFYLHYFAVKQPDLNWDNPKVRDDVFSLMRFWLDKGVDGFRMDVIPLISKPTGLPDLTPQQLASDDYMRLWANGPHRDEYLKQMNREVLSKYDDMSVGEAIGISLAETHAIVGTDASGAEGQNELSMIFNFDAIRINHGAGYTEKPWALSGLKAIYDAHAKTLGKSDWDTVFLSNHDNPRLVSNFGETTTPELRDRSAKLFATMILTLRGTPFLYQGDELGMTNFPFKRLDQFNDIEVKNAHEERVVHGTMSEAQFLAECARFGRDNARTPMQWSSAANAGFTTSGAKPWLAINPNYKTLNAEAELRNSNSVFHYTQHAIEVHHAHPAFVYGDYTDLEPIHPQVFAYTRTLGVGTPKQERFLIILNVGKTPTTYEVPGSIEPTALVLSNLSSTDAFTPHLHLKPWEARVYRY